ncbi:MAG: DUF1835 domain-containing protein [Eubacteriaceae bacterium]|nr:DUF1835 domain-containing protein [Eubacteriaceae bacterium]
MDNGRGHIYDIFFDVSMPLDALRLLTGRRVIPLRDIAMLRLNANIGDIGDNFWEERYKLMKWYDTLVPSEARDTDEMFQILRERCEELASAREGTDVLRIWHGPSSGDICSMAFLMDLVKGRDLTVIDMPLDDMFRFGDLKNAPREVVYRAFSGSSLLTQEKRTDYEKLWKDLSEENAPIRTRYPDGNIAGASDDFFDEEILLKIPDDGCLFSEALRDLEEDRRLDDMGRLFWTRRLRRLTSKGIVEAEYDGDNILESRIRKK